jgi:hypothetical protein
METAAIVQPAGSLRSQSGTWVRVNQRTVLIGILIGIIVATLILITRAAIR